MHGRPPFVSFPPKKITIFGVGTSQSLHVHNIFQQENYPYNSVWIAQHTEIDVSRCDALWHLSIREVDLHVACVCVCTFPFEWTYYIDADESPAHATKVRISVS